MSERREPRPDAWADLEDEADKQPFKVLTHEEAQALMARERSVSPWRVIAVQAVVGMVMAGLLWLITRRQDWTVSVLYGAAAVVVPGALMARGVTSRLSSLAPAVSAVSVMLWEFGKIAVSVAMLALAPKLVPGLSWPALLVALIVCIKVYWVALLWRDRRKS